jgi:hypothetical protein
METTTTIQNDINVEMNIIFNSGMFVTVYFGILSFRVLPKYLKIKIYKGYLTLFQFVGDDIVSSLKPDINISYKTSAKF